MMTPPDHDLYALLGIPANAGPDAVKRAFREKAMRHHPDRDPSPCAADRFRAVHAAYAVLSDPELRARHDERSGRRHQASGPGPNLRREPPGSRAMVRERPPTPSQRMVYRGLHATGLCFGLGLVLSVCASITFLERSWLYLVLTLPGLVVIPDSLAGLRR